MKEIIWVFGTSASGKETFLEKLLGDNELQKLIGINDMRIAVSQESLRNLGKLDQSRSSILDEVTQLIESNDAVVIKWQYGDTLLHTPNTLQDKFPACKHIMIKLNVARDEQVRRLRTKTWWRDKGQEDDFIAKEVLLVENSLSELGTQFIIRELEW